MIHDGRCKGKHSEERSPEAVPEPTRRTLLGAVSGFLLAASGLFLPAEQEVDAANPGNRLQHRAGKHRQRHHRNNKQHRRHQRHDPGDGAGKGPSDILQKGISTWVYNKLPQVTKAELGIFDFRNQCYRQGYWDMPALTGFARYDTSDSTAYSWLDGNYFFYLENPVLGNPKVSVSRGGNFLSQCHSGPSTQLLDIPFATHQKVTVSDGNKKFLITRHPDRDSFKLFTIEIFPR